MIRPSGPRWAAGHGAVAHVLVDALGDRAEVAGADAHHLARARRLRPGAVVTTTDGAGRWRPGRVAAVHDDALVVEATGGVVEEPVVVPAVAVAPALAKAGLDDVVATCTELGVVAVRPIVTERVALRWDATRAARARDRWQRLAREALMRAFRCRLPRIDAPVPFTELVRAPGLDLVVAEPGAGSPWSLALPASGTWTVLSGPEGGFTAAESAVVADAPRVCLAPHVLRAVTAPIAAAAVLGARALGEPGVVGGGGVAG